MINYMLGNSVPSTGATVLPLIVLIVLIILMSLAVKKFIINSKYKNSENYIHTCISVLIIILIIIDTFKQNYNYSDDRFAVFAFWSALISIFTPYNKSSKPSIINNIVTLTCYLLLIIIRLDRMTEFESYIAEQIGYEAVSGISIFVILLSLINCIPHKFIKSLIYDFSSKNFDIKQNTPDDKTEVKNDISTDIPEIEEIKKYKELYDMGIITQEEFNQKKKELLKL